MSQEDYNGKFAPKLKFDTKENIEISNA